ncbi:hypothetical protein [Pseudomaricurvus sp. HS19]|uniref:hypothetical protein n=1 Tax=Pseudomaricurvus sp. HS19 TaxID=2692626 RepID=UPI001368A7E1|nr:hypothetical protein [Pseudomaricurvus sp. HS19]MYM64886.1 hypothetical protein [Pseudomaricurvus sp. HS19]
MKYLQAALISIMTFALTWGAVSAIHQLRLGECAVKGGCGSNVELTIYLGLILSGFFVIPLLGTMFIFMRSRIARHKHSLLLMSLTTSVIAGVSTATSQTRLTGSPLDMILWPLLFVLLSAVAIALFYRKPA